MKRPNNLSCVPPIHINNTGRIVFNQEAATRIDQPKYMKVIIDGDMIRLMPSDEHSEHALEMRYPEESGPYTFSAAHLFKPLGFEPGKGMPAYDIHEPKPYGNGFEFPSPFRRD